MAVDGSTGGGMAVGPAETMTVPSAADVIDPTGCSASQPSVNIDHLRRYDKSCCRSVLFLRDLLLLYEYKQYMHPTDANSRHVRVLLCCIQMYLVPGKVYS